MTAEQSRQQDAIALVDTNTLLDRAGLAVALQAARLGAGYGSRVATLAGPGNNGGDGYVAARYLAVRGASVDIYPLTDPRTGPTRWARRLAEMEGATIRDWTDPRPADVVIDALFGGGFRGELPDLSPWRKGSAWLAVDVPSGLDASTGEAARGAIAADATVTFHGYRVGHLVGSGTRLLRKGDGGGHRIARCGSRDVAMR